MAEYIHFPNNSISYIAPSWEEMDEVCLKLATKISISGRRFDRLVTLAKGGWPMSRSLVDFLSIPEVASIGIRFYAGFDKRLTKPLIYQDLPIAVAGERILLFDDVADTGESLAFTQQHLLDAGVTSVTTASLYYKPHSTFKPDFYGEQTDAWIIFPFEIMESLDQVAKSWQKGGELDEDQLRSGFQRLGLRPSIVHYYFAHYKT